MDLQSSPPSLQTPAWMWNSVIPVRIQLWSTPWYPNIWSIHAHLRRHLPHPWLHHQFPESTMEQKAGPCQGTWWLIMQSRSWLHKWPHFCHRPPRTSGVPWPVRKKPAKMGLASWRQGHNLGLAQLIQRAETSPRVHIPAQNWVSNQLCVRYMC